MIRILLVEDEPHLLEIAKLYLEKDGVILVETSVSADEALERPGLNDYDAIVSDYEMPGKDGIQFLRELRSQGHDVPFIILTGRSREEVVIEALNAGATFYLQKGSDIKSQFSELSSKIFQAVDKRNVEKQLKEANRFLTDVLNAVQDGISVLDKDLNIVHVNPVMERWYGSKDNLIGRKCYHVYQGGDDICEWCPSMIAMDRNELCRKEIPVGLGDGVGYLELSAYPIQDDEGTVSGVLEYVRDITDRKNAELSLAESEKKYRLLVDNSEDIIWSADKELNITYISPSSRHLIGYDEEFIKNNDFFTLFHPDDIETARATLDAVASTDSDRTRVESRIRKPDGSYVWFSSSVTTLKDDNGHVLSYIGVSKDINERKLVEERHNQLFTSMIEACALHEIILDGHGVPVDYRFIDVNPSFENITGLKADDLIGRTVKEVLPGTEDDWIEIYGNVALTGNDASFCNYSKELDRYFHVSAFRPKPMHFACVFSDITAMRKAEDQIIKSEERLKLAMEGTKAVLWDWDLVDNKVETSHQTSAMLGYLPEEFSDDTMDWYDMCHPDDIGKLRMVMEDHLSGVTEHIEFPYRVMHKDGDWRWIMSRGKAIRNSKGEPVRWVGTNIDITEQKVASESLKIANRKLHLLSNITRHDILNSLMVIEGYLELAESMDHKEEWPSILSNLRRASANIGNHIRFMKEYQSIGEGHPDWIPLNLTLSDLDDPRLIITECFNGYEVLADPMLPRVFYNLMDNSQRHAPDGTRMVLDCSETQDGLLIIFEDDGPGIPEAEKDHIFRKGYGKNTGHGLFLAIELLSFTGISMRECGKHGEGVRFEISVPNGKWRAI